MWRGQAFGLGEFEGAQIGRFHDGAVEVRVVEHGDGSRSAILVPRGIKRLGEEGFEVMHSLQHITGELAQLSDALEREVNGARALGFSWASIGFCIGTTGEAARQRWGYLDE